MLAALACIATACTDEDRQLRGRLLVGTIAAEDGTAVGLAVEFLRTSGSRDAMRDVALEVFAQGDLLLSSTGAAAALCLPFSESGRVSLLAQDGKLDASSRVMLVAHYQPVSEATDAGNNSATAAAPISCAGLVIDDAVWPTRGAQVIPLPATGGAGGIGGAGGAGGSSGTGSGGAGGSSDDPDASPTDGGQIDDASPNGDG